jgi:hypothetical protein
MQNLLTAVLVGFVSAVIVTAAYHLLVAAPQSRRLLALLETHDALLGGGGATKASERFAVLDRVVADAEAARGEALRRIDALERIAHREIPRIGFLRYNAFSDVGSDLSYALALLNREGDGVVLSSIWSREETRTYGKAVSGFKPAQDPSEEELAAIARARVV